MKISLISYTEVEKEWQTCWLAVETMGAIAQTNLRKTGSHFYLYLICQSSQWMDMQIPNSDKNCEKISVFRSFVNYSVKLKESLFPPPIVHYVSQGCSLNKS